MSSWGASTTDESKPKYLTDAEKRDCYATDRGWTIPAGGNPNGEREVIAAIGGLSGGTSTTAGLARATISSIRITSTAFSAGTTGSLNVEVVYNENVDVTQANGISDTIKLTVINDTPARNQVLDYTGGTVTGKNRLTFSAVIVANTLTEDDVLSIAAGNVVLAGAATIQDAGTTVDSGLAHGAGSDTLTVSA
jgi:hypothetical protein